ncbi:unnamed protein product [Paramecium sonneborni]|uniref:Uncharacterized protein n=1 Tax=Paramecium sonneborni TaxID=65129 RepID=A0A8S1PE94_9CILI|nr:unnamed protein product [Paramecium sonneborni]
MIKNKKQLIINWSSFDSLYVPQRHYENHLFFEQIEIIKVSHKIEKHENLIWQQIMTNY